MKKILFSRCFILACKPTQKTVIPAWVPYDETEEVAKLLPMHPQNAIQSYPIKILDKMTFGKI
jgi:amidase